MIKNNFKWNTSSPRGYYSTDCYEKGNTYCNDGKSFSNGSFGCLSGDVAAIEFDPINMKLYYTNITKTRNTYVVDIVLPKNKDIYFVAFLDTEKDSLEIISWLNNFDQIIYLNINSLL